MEKLFKWIISADDYKWHCVERADTERVLTEDFHDFAKIFTLGGHL